MRQLTDGEKTAVDDGHIRVEFPRAADELHGLMAEVSAISQKDLIVQELVQSLAESDLIFALTSAESDPGLVILDAELLDGLIEVQTTGRVTSKPVAKRTPSRTDGVIVSDIVDRWLRDLVDRGSSPGRVGRTFDEARRENRQLDLRAVALLLDPGVYTSLRVTLSMAGGAKTGAISFVLPHQPKQHVPGGSTGQEAGDSTEVINPLPAQLYVDMARVSYPLSRIQALEPATFLPIPKEQLGRAKLRAINGRDVATVALGQVEGRWAIRPLITAAATPVGRGEEMHSAFLPGAPETETLPAVSQEPPMPPMPDETPPTSELPDLPSLSQLPDLPELPDLPDLPDLPAIDP